VAPDDVFTVRTYGDTRPRYGPKPPASAQISGLMRTNPQVNAPRPAKVHDRDQSREERLARMTAIAEATQLALLPPLPAQMIGVNIAARYRSATHEASVGGDLYEIIPTGPIGCLAPSPAMT
jgi:hypothetical protein